MYYHLIAESMRDTTDKLLGVKINAWFTPDTIHLLHPDFIISAWDSEQKRNFMLEQIRLIVGRRDRFEYSSLTCTLNFIDEVALLAIDDPAIRLAPHALQSIALELSERFLLSTVCLNNLLTNSLRDGPNALRLGDLGSGSVGVSPLVCSHFDTVKLGRGSFSEQVERPMLPVPTKNIREYRDRAVMKGGDDTWLSDALSNASIWIVQGDIFPSVTSNDTEVSLPVKILH